MKKSFPDRGEGAASTSSEKQFQDNSPEQHRAYLKGVRCASYLCIAPGPSFQQIISGRSLATLRLKFVPLCCLNIEQS